MRPHSFYKLMLALIGVLSAATYTVCYANEAEHSEKSPDTKIYQEKDSKGVPLFSDQPSPHAKPVTLQPVNTTEKLKSLPTVKKDRPAASTQYAIRVREPADHTFFENTLAGVPVSVMVKPELAEGMTVEILLNGEVVDEGATTQFTLYRIPSGTHTIEAVLKRGDSELSRTKPVSIQTIRPGG